MSKAKQAATTASKPRQSAAKPAKAQSWGAGENSATDKKADATVKRTMGRRAPAEGSPKDNALDRQSAKSNGIKLVGKPNPPVPRSVPRALPTRGR